MVPPAKNGRSGRQVAWLLLAPAIFLVVMQIVAAGLPLIHGDSESYLAFEPMRSGGYPAFLALLKPFIQELHGYAIVQRWLYAFAVFVLGIELLRCLGSPVIAVLAQIALLFNPEVDRYHSLIATESLFLSVSALFLAAAIAHLRAGGLWSLAAASLAVGALIAIRPTGVVCLLPLILLWLVRPVVPRRLWAGTMAVFVPLLLVIALESSFYASRHSGSRESLAPIHLLAKAAMIESPDADAVLDSVEPAGRPLWQALQTSWAPVRRLLAGAPGQSAWCLLGPSYEALAQYGLAPTEGSVLVAHEGPDALTTIALKRLRTNIGGYLQLSLNHLVCLWMVGSATAAEGTALSTYLAEQAPLPFESDIRHVLGGARFPPFPVAVRCAMALIAAILAIVGLAVVVAPARRRRPALSLAAAGLCGIWLHAGFVLTALAGVSIPRYVLGLWVPLAMGTGLAGLWIVSRLGIKASGAKSPGTDFVGM